MKKFTLVSLDKEVTNYLADHEILMSFNNDGGSYAFEAWWNDIGSAQFYDWLSKSDEFKDECG